MLPFGCGFGFGFDCLASCTNFGILTARSTGFLGATPSALAMQANWVSVDFNAALVGEGTSLAPWRARATTKKLSAMRAAGGASKCLATVARPVSVRLVAGCCGVTGREAMTAWFTAWRCLHQVGVAMVCPKGSVFAAKLGQVQNHKFASVGVTVHVYSTPSSVCERTTKEYTPRPSGWATETAGVGASA